MYNSHDLRVLSDGISVFCGNPLSFIKAINLKEVSDIAPTRLQRLVSRWELVYMKHIRTMLKGLLGILNAASTLR
jgi:hypothetical protein